jgi:hypothetical protein
MRDPNVNLFFDMFMWNEKFMADILGNAANRRIAESRAIRHSRHSHVIAPSQYKDEQGGKDVK